ncbi:MAG: hypothetical protein KGZ67_03145, partial [Hydrogenophaga sp.]|nr:hypothetical protein [Hydrogenophaga sp.]
MIHHTLVAGAVALLLGLPPAGAEAQSVPIEPAGSPAASAAQPQLDAALSALRAGNLPAAEQHFQAAVARDPQSAAGYLGMAEVAGRRGDQKTVEAWLRKGMAAA